MDPIAAEKRTAMLRYSRLQRLTTLLRCLELLALALLAFWSSAQIPAAARSSADLVCRLLPVLLGPRFLFLLGNAIVITLLLKSRHLSTSAADDNDTDTSTTIGDEISAFVSPPPPQLPTPALAPAPAKEEVVFEDKKVCVEGPPRACRRSRSVRVGDRRRRSPELRRSETDVGKGKEVDEEEFRRTIEAFIEKQWKFQREESMAIVCSAGLTRSAGTLEAAKEIIT